MQNVARRGPRIISRRRAEIGKEFAERTIRAIARMIGGDAEVAIGVDERDAERVGAATTLNHLPPVAVSPLLWWRRVAGIVPKKRWAYRDGHKRCFRGIISLEFHMYRPCPSVIGQVA